MTDHRIDFLPRLQLQDNLSNRRIACYFDDATGISAGTPVTRFGVPVGTTIGLNVEDDGAVATISVSRDLSLFADASATLRIRELTGGKVIVLDPGNSQTGAVDGPIRGTNEADLGQIVATAADLSEKAGPMLARIDTLLISLTRLVGDPQLQQDIRSGLGSFASSGRQLNDLLLTARPRLDATLASSSGLVDELRSIVGETREPLAAALASFGAVGSEGEGAVRDLRRSLRRIDSIGVRVDNILGSVENGKGIAPRLLHDEVLANEVVETVKVLKSVIARLGTQGMNVNVELGHE